MDLDADGVGRRRRGSQQADKENLKLVFLHPLQISA